jgi:hypothetical protein
MLGNLLFMLGFVGFLTGLAVGIAMLQDHQDVFLRNVMFAGGVAVSIFIILGQLGAERPLTAFLLVFSAFGGGIAVLLIALAARGKLFAGFMAGAAAGAVQRIMLALLPEGSFGPMPMHDLALLVDIVLTMLTGGSVYYLLRNWGDEGHQWD